jgi:hypothetical protein
MAVHPEVVGRSAGAVQDAVAFHQSRADGDNIGMHGCDRAKVKNAGGWLSNG